MEEIDRKDMLGFAACLRDEKGLSPRSCRNKFNQTMMLLMAHDISKIVRKADWPVYTEQDPEIYEQQELNALLAACNDQERIWFEFFLMTGMRDQEVMHCGRRDVNVQQSTIAASAKTEFCWTLKAYKGREFPVPISLLDSLSAIKPAN
jgi:integrase/recombinase XerD